MRKKTIGMGLLLGLLLTLSGCFSKSVGDLYCLPKAPQDYVELDAQINVLREELGAEYASPRSGSNTAPVQLQDLDGDGQVESVVTFFRASSGGFPLKICILRQRPDESYAVSCTIEGDGQAINSVSYVDLNGDGDKEVLVSWQMGSKQYILAPYQLGPTGAIQMGEISYNRGYISCDLNQDQVRELVVFQAGESEPKNGWAEHYIYDDGKMVQSSTAPLSNNIGDDSSIRQGNLVDGVPAVYISSSLENATVTDLFALRDGVLANITLNEETGISDQTLRYVDISPTDINRDGTLELPEPIAVREYKPAAAASNFWIIRWRQFDLTGGSRVVQNTYHNLNNPNDPWYLTIPDQWIGLVTISRDDARAIQGERAVVFSYWNGDQETPPQPFLRIYRLEGDNRETRAKLGNRFVLVRKTRLIYAAELIDAQWDSGMTKDLLKQSFAVIQTEWSSQ